MALDFTPQTVSSGHQSTDTIEENNTNIQTALADGLSRSGNAPNTMSANLDMNSNRVINLSAPTANSDAARYIDVLGGITTSDAVLPSQSGNTEKFLSTDGSNWVFKDIMDDESLYQPTITNTSDRTMLARLQEYVSVKDFGAVGDGATDDTTAIQNALDSQLPVYMPPGVYIVSSTLTFSNGSKLIGAGAWHGVRDNNSEAYDASFHTVIKASGISGSNSCVVRLSKVAVGTEATDFTPPGTDDLYSVRFEGITVDGAGTAEFGVYIYRLLDSHIKDVAVESCAEHGFFIIGSFTNVFEHMTAYSNEKNGWTIGYDIFSFSSTEQAVNACTFIKPVARYNGTGDTYNQSTNTDEGHGFMLQLNRANNFIGLVSEKNDGAGLYLKTDTGNFGGPNKFITGYIENNQNDVIADTRGTDEYNIIFENSGRANMRHFEFDGMFIHPDGGIYIAGSLTQTDPEAFITFKNCYSSTTITIDAGTPSFRVENFSPTPTYGASTPNVQTLSGAGAIDVVNYKTHWTTTGSDAATLADGVFEGQQKLIFLVSDGGTGTLTPTSFGDGTTMTFADGNDFVLLEWINGNWWVIRNNGVVVA